MNNINHPAHYGGADNPYEVIKVLEEWLTPQEFVGFLKGNVIKYNARARAKGRLDDHEKALWYQQRLVEFGRQESAEAVFPELLFWGNDGAFGEDEVEVAQFAPIACVTAVHSNEAPHTRWAVQFYTSEDGDTDIEWFDDPDKAQAFRASLTEPKAPPTLDPWDEPLPSVEAAPNAD